MSAVAALLLVAGCASSPSRTPDGSSQRDVYAGNGRGPSLALAMNDAKMDAVRNAVIDMVGAEAEAANSATLESVLYNTRNPNAFVHNETMETVRRENVGSIDEIDMIYQITIRVNRSAIESVLAANNITAAEVAAERRSPQELVQDTHADVETPAQRAATAALEAQVDDWELATPEEQRFIRRYVDTMTYLVYFSQESPESPFVMRSGVNQANSYLTSNGMTAVDAGQVESLTRDQQLVYEQETGREVSILQWVAQRLGADVYIELDAVTSGETQGGTHYGSANVTLRMFETSTGQLLGSVNRRSQRTASRSSQEDAALNALQSTVYQAMPLVVEQSRIQMANAVARGVRYQVVIQNSADSRMMSELRRRLRSRVSDIITVSQTAEQTQYDVFYFGRIDELEDLMYDVSATVPGMERMYHVMTRGKSLTFNTGW
ncbi:MAG: hypothetical protein EA384_08435 [Spirochaetaceae bacterium]|nr:MAG: hypothetical protein EA384_08435 [Spirochaetaceae bacterium]